MPHVITSLCVRDGACAEVCPVECITPGKPTDQWPTYYIDADACIDCDACAQECPNHAIFIDSEVPSDYLAKGGEKLSKPVGTAGFTETYDGVNHNGEAVHLKCVRTLAAGEKVDLTPAIDENKKFYSSGPGYSAK